MSTDHDVTDVDKFDGEDAELLVAVRELYDRIDPVPAGLADQICFTVALENADTELALLLESELTGVRGAPETQAEEARTVIFESSSVTIMVSVTPVGTDRVRVDGWLSPEGSYRVELRTLTDLIRQTSDDTGRFVIEEAPSETFRLVIRLPQSLVHTDNPPVVLTPTISWN